MIVKVVRFELYPVDIPQGNVVGFNIITNNNKSFYMDTLINFNEIPSNSSDNDIVDIAYKKLKDKIKEKCLQLKNEKPVFDIVFKDTEEEVEVEEQPQNPEVSSNPEQPQTPTVGGEV